MSHLAIQRHSIIAAIVVVGFGSWVYGQWSAPQLLNESGETNCDIKDMKTAASASGGFHAMYRVYGCGDTKLRYRRFQGSTLGPAQTIFDDNFNAIGNIIEAGDGTVHVVFEDWASGPRVGWVRSTNGGVTWSASTQISSGGNAKFPLIARLGLGASAQVVMSYYNTDNKNIYSNKWNGSAWEGQIDTGANGSSEYQVHGICSSLQDGSIYRGFNDGDWVAYKQYNGASWGSTQLVQDVGFFSNQALAVNTAGQVLSMWDTDNKAYARIYTPGSGWGPTHTVWNSGFKGIAVAIPGTNDFYAVNPAPNNAGAQGRRWSNGSWQSVEQIGPSGFTPGAHVSVASDGTLYATWEYWGSGRPQAWFAIKGGGGGGPTGTLQGYVRDQFGQGVSGAAVNVGAAFATGTDGNGFYTIDVPGGTYSAVASKTFYTPQTVNNVQVIDNQTQNQDFTITGSGPNPVALFEADPKSEAVDLTWLNSNSANVSGTKILYSTQPITGPNDPNASVYVDQPGGPNDYYTPTQTGLTNGVPLYYAAYSYYQDASRFYSSGVFLQDVTPAVDPDMDRDGDVDQADHGPFQACLSGDGIPQTDPACEQALLDGDNDVDSNDFQIFVDCISGPNNYAVPTCAN